MTAVMAFTAGEVLRRWRVVESRQLSYELCVPCNVFAGYGLGPLGVVTFGPGPAILAVARQSTFGTAAGTSRPASTFVCCWCLPFFTFTLHPMVLVRSTMVEMVCSTAALLSCKTATSNDGGMPRNPLCPRMIAPANTLRASQHCFFVLDVSLNTDIGCTPPCILIRGAFDYCSAASL